LLARSCSVAVTVEEIAQQVIRLLRVEVGF
jgi:hypothetical protein